MTTDKALVLGGGGVTGVAWEIGMLAGLAEHGADLSDADLVVGTSAGSIAGTDIRSGVGLEELYLAHLAPPDGEVTAKIGAAVLVRYGLALGLTRDPVRARRRVGAFALKARTESEAERRTVIESRVQVRRWPEGRLRITAVDARTGELTVFDAASGVDIVDAVGASCAVPGVWPPVTIAGRRYIDGGTRSPANADLADECGRVVVIAPITDGFGTIASVASEARELRRQGAEVVVISPDRAASRAIGKNVLDPARRATAARAGREQAAALADAVAAIWSQA